MAISIDDGTIYGAVYMFLGICLASGVMMCGIGLTQIFTLETFFIMIGSLMFTIGLGSVVAIIILHLWGKKE